MTKSIKDAHDILTVRPLESEEVSQRFRANPRLYKRWGTAGHEGLDIVADVGAVVYATGKGVVVYAGAGGWGASPAVSNHYGIHAVIDHGEYRTLYAHLESVVKSGTYVEAGTPIGTVGLSGRTSGAHLHFSVLDKSPTGKHPATWWGWFVNPAFIMDLPSPVA